MKPILSDLGLVTHGDEHAWAVTSPDDRYRYVLGRMWDDYFENGRDLWDRDPVRPLWVFCMLNPSKARVDDDPTVRKCTGFAKLGGAGGFLVVNLFAYSATHPRDMVMASKAGANIFGEKNAEAIHWATSRPALLGRHIAAWGKLPPRLRSAALRGRAQFLRYKADCLGVNLDGSPCHPLMLGYDTPVVPLADAQARRTEARP